VVQTLACLSSQLTKKFSNIDTNPRPNANATDWNYQRDWKTSGNVNDGKSKFELGTEESPGNAHVKYASNVDRNNWKTSANWNSSQDDYGGSSSNGRTRHMSMSCSNGYNSWNNQRDWKTSRNVNDGKSKFDHGTEGSPRNAHVKYMSNIDRNNWKASANWNSYRDDSGVLSSNGRTRHMSMSCSNDYNSWRSCPAAMATTVGGHLVLVEAIGGCPGTPKIGIQSTTTVPPSHLGKPALGQGRIQITTRGRH